MLKKAWGTLRSTAQLRSGKNIHMSRCRLRKDSQCAAAALLRTSLRAHNLSRFPVSTVFLSKERTGWQWRGEARLWTRVFSHWPKEIFCLQGRYLAQQLRCRDSYVSPSQCLIWVLALSHPTPASDLCAPWEGSRWLKFLDPYERVRLSSKLLI